MRIIIKMLKHILGALTPYKQGGLSGEVPSPRVAISPHQITYQPPKQKLIIEGILPDIWVTTVQGTNSMEPAIDIWHTVVLSNHPNYMKQELINVGDVIVWNQTRLSVIHTVIEIGQDSAGWYCYTQGTNLIAPDPAKIRYEDITWVSLMVVWSDKKPLGSQLYSQVYREALDYTRVYREELEK